MLKVGITGGIGSGKTTVCKIFGWAGVPIFNTDEQTKSLYKNQEVKSEVIKLLGPESYIDYNTIDRKFISGKIFSDKNLKRELTTKILYPRLWNNLDIWCNKQTSEYGLIETALLFEHNIQDKFDKTILVYSNLEKRIKRVLYRDNCTREEVLARIGNSIPEEAKINMADYIIFNNGESLDPQVIDIHIKILNLK